MGGRHLPAGRSIFVSCVSVLPAHTISLFLDNSSLRSFAGNTRVDPCPVLAHSFLVCQAAQIPHQIHMIDMAGSPLEDCSRSHLSSSFATAVAYSPCSAAIRMTVSHLKWWIIFTSLNLADRGLSGVGLLRQRLLGHFQLVPSGLNRFSHVVSVVNH